MIKILIAIFILSTVSIQSVFAETTQLKQWIAPSECVVDGEILTQEECDELLNPTPPSPSPNAPVTSSATNASSQKPALPVWQISSFLLPFTASNPASVDEAGMRIVDRAETHAPSQEDFVINLIVLLLVIFGAGLVIFTSHRRSANLPK